MLQLTVFICKVFNLNFFWGVVCFILTYKCQMEFGSVFFALGFCNVYGALESSSNGAMLLAWYGGSIGTFAPWNMRPDNRTIQYDLACLFHGIGSKWSKSVTRCKGKITKKQLMLYIWKVICPLLCLCGLVFVMVRTVPSHFLCPFMVPIWSPVTF